MEQVESVWNGYRRLDFTFMEKAAILICPKQPREDGKWLFKTEYFGAFPAFELEMLERGYYVANLKNTTRWCLPEDTERQAEFCEFLRDRFGLSRRCMPVGMSCGGMQAVYLAAEHPELVEALYLDAPVMNRLSCPCNVGRGGGGAMYEEMVERTGWTVSYLINDRHQPVDLIHRLVESRIPLALICGDSDTVVPYAENGAVLAERYRGSGVPFFEVVKHGCDHHPHGPESMDQLLEFAERYYG